MKIFFQTFYPRLRYYCYDILKDHAQAQDISQEAIATFWHQRSGFKQSSIKEAGAFLFTVARNKCYDHLKHLKVISRKEIPIADSTPIIDNMLEIKIIKEDLLSRIYREMHRLLPSSQAQLLTMIFAEGLSTQEIAEKLGTTPNNIRNQKARALERLRTILQKYHLFVFLFISCDACIPTVVHL